MRRFLLSAVGGLRHRLRRTIASAQTLKVVMHSDVKVLDPIWSGAYITRNHGYMLYDVLFSMDEKFQVKRRWSTPGPPATTALSGPSSCATGWNGTTASRNGRGMHRLSEALVGARRDGPEDGAGVEGI